jgi:hypothetical protein
VTKVAAPTHACADCRPSANLKEQAQHTCRASAWQSEVCRSERPRYVFEHLHVMRAWCRWVQRISCFTVWVMSLDGPAGCTMWICAPDATLIGSRSSEINVACRSPQTLGTDALAAA